MNHDITVIRNLAIIAHIDHGKSTLADAILERLGAVEARKMQAQLLDSMDLEREKGITIKSQTVRLYYEENGVKYIINIIDTPGHVDFTYEVNRSLSACEGALLIVDSTQGVEAQTLTNAYMSIENDHVIIPVLNKIDLQSSEPERVREEIEHILGIDTDETVNVSAKTGEGIEELLKSIIRLIPAPQGNLDATLKAIIIDSWYDNYLGVVILIRVYDGEISARQTVQFISKNQNYIIGKVGVFTPAKVDVDALRAGEIGFITANIKNTSECEIGDTITNPHNPCEALPGFNPSQPVVFSSIFPEEADEFENLTNALAKLNLNDSSFTFMKDSSNSLGHGYRCGFLGLLHMEIITERLEREFNIDLITTAPSVSYIVHMNDGEVLEIANPSDLPDQVKINFIEEPFITATIIVPEQYLGSILNLCNERRGEQVSMDYSGNRSIVIYKFPLGEIVFDFYDRLKSISSGYASFNWEVDDHRQAPIVKVSILVNGDPVDALSYLVHKERAEARGREICEKLIDLIPRQLFKIAIQAAIGGKVIARETINAVRKDVTAKCYGGDVTRKRKLLEKQKKGKKKMLAVGNVNIPKKVFIDVLKVKDGK